ncbi:hypothetical protein E3A20_12340 [Planctomyces bekefii]|uniref:Uncharacterized protein n=1 Tax=Planctomyces bekefii TaxID=1653850 RepID=A0A5C6M6L6_9PLAN|nr:hypothetical protein E3A20_12340 [Planctomyces bekefii]
MFSSHSKWRSLVVKNPKARKGFNPETVDRTKVKNHKRAKLLKRIFKIDVGTCPVCGGDLVIGGAIQDPAEIRRYLHHVGIEEHPPPVAPARNEQMELVGLGYVDELEVQVHPNYE